MRRLILQTAARRSLEDIVSFVNEISGSSDAGERVADALLTQCERLARLPGMLGRPRPDLLPDLRSFVAGRYSIFFRYQASALVVVNILHASRDIDDFFSDGP